MTERTVVHGNFTIERTYAAAPARVFAAWSSKDALLRWGNPGEGWEIAYDRFDFRVGGGDTSRFGPKGGETYLSEGHYEDIVQDARIVSAYTMTCAGKRLFVGLLTVELYPAASGTRLLLTEQGAYLDGGDIPANHESGWGSMLDKLAEEVGRERAA